MAGINVTQPELFDQPLASSSGRRYSAETKAAALADYASGRSAKRIAADLGCRDTTVLKWLHKAGAAIRTTSEACRIHSLDESAFDEPLGPSARYWAGFLMADGACVAQRWGHPIVLALQASDRAHVEAFRSFLGSSHAITECRPNKFRIGDRVVNSGPSVRLSVSSKRLFDALGRLGIVPRKSATAQVIGLENDRDFWRGAVEGDGVVSLHRDRDGVMPYVNLVGSPQLVGQFAAFARTIAPRAALTVHSVKRKRSHARASATGVSAAKIVAALYRDCEVALPRKLAAAQQIMAWEPKTDRERWDGFTAERLTELLAEYGEWQAVAAAMGVSEAWLQVLRKRAGCDAVPPPRPPCGVPGCKGTTVFRGYCVAHRKMRPPKNSDTKSE